MPIRQHQFTSRDAEAMDQMLASRPFGARADDAPATSASNGGHRLGGYALGSSPARSPYEDDYAPRPAGSPYEDGYAPGGSDPDAAPSPARRRLNLGGHREDPSGALAPSNDRRRFVPAPELKPISAGAQYAGEDKTLGWRADLNPNVKALSDPASPTYDPGHHAQIAAKTDVRVTQYLSEQQRRQHQLSVSKDGLLKRGSGALMDTSDGAGGGLNPSEGAEIFALGLNGALNAADAARQYKLRPLEGGPDEMFHHTSFYAGGDVAGAGELKVEQGHLREVSDQSGHYKPPAETTHQAVAHMARSREEGGLGISMVDDTPDASGHAVNKPVNVRLGGKPGLGDDSVTLTHQQFLQTGGNEKQIRAKMGLNAQIEEMGGKRAQLKALPFYDGLGADTPDPAPSPAPAAAPRWSGGYGNRPATQYANQPADLWTGGYANQPAPVWSGGYANAHLPQAPTPAPPGGYDTIPSGLGTPSGYDSIPPTVAAALTGGYDAIPPGLGIPSGYDAIPSSVRSRAGTL